MEFGLYRLEFEKNAGIERVIEEKSFEPVIKQNHGHEKSQQTTFFKF